MPATWTMPSRAATCLHWSRASDSIQLDSDANTMMDADTTLSSLCRTDDGREHRPPAQTISRPDRRWAAYSRFMAAGTKDDPWVLRTPPGSSEYTMYRDETADPPLLVCQVGSTKLTYQSRAVEDLHAWLREQGDWVALGAADENKPAAGGTVEAWGRSADNPVGARNNRMRAI